MKLNHMSDINELEIELSESFHIRIDYLTWKTVMFGHKSLHFSTPGISYMVDYLGFDQDKVNCYILDINLTFIRFSFIKHVGECEIEG